MKKEKKKIDVIFLLDRSGSMHGSEEDTIGGYNSYLNEQKKNNTLITTVLFDDNYELLHFREKITEINDLTKEQYYVRGCTALYDAIGTTIEKLEKQKIDNKVLFIITTDGLENASQRFNKKKVSSLIKKHSDWEFIYLGANIDSYQEAASIGISKDRACNYSKSQKGFKNLFATISNLSECLSKDIEIGTEWKNNLK